MKPEDLFETDKSFQHVLGKFHIVEFGNGSRNRKSHVFEYNASPQPSFNKNFELIVKNLDENQEKNIQNIIVSDSFQQHRKLESIFMEIDPYLKYEQLNVAFRNGFHRP